MLCTGRVYDNNNSRQIACITTHPTNDDSLGKNRAIMLITQAMHVHV